MVDTLFPPLNTKFKSYTQGQQHPQNTHPTIAMKIKHKHKATYNSKLQAPSSNQLLQNRFTKLVPHVSKHSLPADAPISMSNSTGRRKSHRVGPIESGDTLPSPSKQWTSKLYKNAHTPSIHTKHPQSHTHQHKRCNKNHTNNGRRRNTSGVQPQLDPWPLK